MGSLPGRNRIMKADGTSEVVFLRVFSAGPGLATMERNTIRDIRVAHLPGCLLCLKDGLAFFRHFLYLLDLLNDGTFEPPFYRFDRRRAITVSFYATRIFIVPLSFVSSTWSRRTTAASESPTVAGATAVAG